MPMARLATRTTSSMVGSARASKFAAYGIGTCGRFTATIANGDLPASLRGAGFRTSGTGNAADYTA